MYNLDSFTLISIYLNISANVTGDVLSGLVASDCKVPCRKTTCTVVEGPVTESDNGANSVYISFTHSVSVTTVTLDTFDINTALNFLGSNLGLLPGMGLFQLLEGTLSFLAVYKIGTKAKQWFRKK